MNLQVQRYKLDKVLVKGTVEHITPVIDHWEEMEEENDGIKGRQTEGEAMRVTEREGDGSKKKVKYFQVRLQEGIVLKARRVVMATGPTRAQMANIPSWVKSIGESYPEERLQHTVHLMHHLPTARHKLRDAGCQRQKDTEGESDSFRKDSQGNLFHVFFFKYSIMLCFLLRFLCFRRLQWPFDPTLSFTSTVCLCLAGRVCSV